MEKRVFNLLKPLAAPPSMWDKVYDWVLWRARIVILVAVMVVVVAFVLKVIEDTNARNKEKQIEQIQNEINFFASSLEQEFRIIHKKTDQYALIWNNSSNVNAVLTEIYQYITNPSSQLSIKIEGASVSIYGYDSLDDLRTIESALKTSPVFEEVKIESLSLEQADILEQRGLYVLVAIIKNNNRKSI